MKAPAGMPHHVRCVEVHLPSWQAEPCRVTFGRGGMIFDGDWQTYLATPASLARLMRLMNGRPARARQTVFGSGAFLFTEEKNNAAPKRKGRA